MGTARSLRTLLTGAAWRLTRADRLAHDLVRTATTPDEDAATIACMMLTKGGSSGVPIVRDAIAAGHPELVDVLVSIGDHDARRALIDLSQQQTGAVADAAARGLAQVDRAGPSPTTDPHPQE